MADDALNKSLDDLIKEQRDKQVYIMLLLESVLLVFLSNNVCFENLTFLVSLASLLTFTVNR